MKALKYINIFTALAVLVALAACSDKKEKETEEETDETPSVKVETVSERDVAQEWTYTATVEADKVNNISAMMANRIREIYVEEGQRVSKGQKLVVMDDINATNYQIQVDNARASLANITLDYNRALELYKIGGGTKQAVDQMQTQVINAKNALAAAERTLKNAAENTVLVSPINGVVTARNYDPGDMTANLPVITVGQIQPNVKVMVNISENDYESIKRGMPVKVTFDAFPDDEFSGHVSRIYPTVDPASRTFQTEILISNASGKIMPGMFARVDVNLGSQSHIVVPDRAVVKQTGSGNKYVYVYKNGTVEYIQVETGQRIGNSYELISGLADGDSVVITGQNALQNGIRVQPIYRK